MSPLPHEILSRLAPWGLDVGTLVAEFHLTVRWELGCVVVTGHFGGHIEKVEGAAGRASGLQRAVIMAAYMQVVGAEEGGRV